jgi:hypothetical protein
MAGIEKRELGIGEKRTTTLRAPLEHLYFLLTSDWGVPEPFRWRGYESLSSATAKFILTSAETTQLLHGRVLPREVYVSQQIHELGSEWKGSKTDST